MEDGGGWDNTDSEDDSLTLLPESEDEGLTLLPKSEEEGPLLALVAMGAGSEVAGSYAFQTIAPMIMPQQKGAEAAGMASSF